MSRCSAAAAVVAAVVVAAGELAEVVSPVAVGAGFPAAAAILAG
jgi:hypothetical protein